MEKIKCHQISCPNRNAVENKKSNRNRGRKGMKRMEDNHLLMTKYKLQGKMPGKIRRIESSNDIQGKEISQILLERLSLEYEDNENNSEDNKLSRTLTQILISRSDECYRVFQSQSSMSVWNITPQNISSYESDLVLKTKLIETDSQTNVSYFSNSTSKSDVVLERLTGWMKHGYNENDKQKYCKTGKRYLNREKRSDVIVRYSEDRRGKKRKQDDLDQEESILSENTSSLRISLHQQYLPLYWTRILRNKLHKIDDEQRQRNNILDNETYSEGFKSSSKSSFSRSDGTSSNMDILPFLLMDNTEQFYLNSSSTKTNSSADVQKRINSTDSGATEECIRSKSDTVTMPDAMKDGLNHNDGIDKKKCKQHSFGSTLNTPIVLPLTTKSTVKTGHKYHFQVNMNRPSINELNPKVQFQEIAFKISDDTEYPQSTEGSEKLFNSNRREEGKYDKIPVEINDENDHINENDRVNKEENTEKPNRLEEKEILSEKPLSERSKSKRQVNKGNENKNSRSKDDRRKQKKKDIPKLKSEQSKTEPQTQRNEKDFLRNNNAKALQKDEDIENCNCQKFTKPNGESNKPSEKQHDGKKKLFKEKGEKNQLRHPKNVQVDEQNVEEYTPEETISPTNVQLEEKHERNEVAVDTNADTFTTKTEIHSYDQLLSEMKELKFKLSSLIEELESEPSPDLMNKVSHIRHLYDRITVLNHTMDDLHNVVHRKEWDKEVKEYEHPIEEERSSSRNDIFEKSDKIADRKVNEMEDESSISTHPAPNKSSEKMEESSQMDNNDPNKKLNNTEFQENEEGPNNLDRNLKNDIPRKENVCSDDDDCDCEEKEQVKEESIKDLKDKAKDGSPFLEPESKKEKQNLSKTSKRHGRNHLVYAVNSYKKENKSLTTNLKRLTLIPQISDANKISPKEILYLKTDNDHTVLESETCGKQDLEKIPHVASSDSTAVSEKTTVLDELISNNIQSSVKEELLGSEKNMSHDKEDSEEKDDCVKKMGSSKSSYENNAFMVESIPSSTVSIPFHLKNIEALNVCHDLNNNTTSDNQSIVSNSECRKAIRQNLARKQNTAWSILKKKVKSLYKNGKRNNETDSRIVPVSKNWSKSKLVDDKIKTSKQRLRYIRKHKDSLKKHRKPPKVKRDSGSNFSEITAAFISNIKKIQDRYKDIETEKNISQVLQMMHESQEIIIPKGSREANKVNNYESITNLRQTTTYIPCKKTMKNEESFSNCSIQRFVPICRNTATANERMPWKISLTNILLAKVNEKLSESHKIRTLDGTLSLTVKIVDERSGRALNADSSSDTSADENEVAIILHLVEDFKRDGNTNAADTILIHEESDQKNVPQIKVEEENETNQEVGKKDKPLGSIVAPKEVNKKIKEKPKSSVSYDKAAHHPCVNRNCANPKCVKKEKNQNKSKVQRDREQRSTPLLEEKGVENEKVESIINYDVTDKKLRLESKEDQTDVNYSNPENDTKAEKNQVTNTTPKLEQVEKNSAKDHKCICGSASKTNKNSNIVCDNPNCKVIKTNSDKSENNPKVKNIKRQNKPPQKAQNSRKNENNDNGSQFSMNKKSKNEKSSNEISGKKYSVDKTKPEKGSVEQITRKTSKELQKPTETKTEKRDKLPTKKLRKKDSILSDSKKEGGQKIETNSAHNSTKSSHNDDNPLKSKDKSIVETAIVIDDKAQQINALDRTTKSHEAKTIKCVWALTKVNLYENGTRSFEIIQATANPPGYFLITDNDESPTNLIWK